MNNTPEQREAARRRLAELWKDPTFRAARKKAIDEATERNRITGEVSRKKSEAMKAAWADPARRARIMAGVRKKKNSGYYETEGAQIFAATLANPETQEKRLKRLREYHADNQGLRRASIAAVNRKKRGFDVPANLWNEYQFLLKKKGVKAREAGIMLGLIRG